jgi:hypothetical protein
MKRPGVGRADVAARFDAGIRAAGRRAPRSAGAHKEAKGSIPRPLAGVEGPPSVAPTSTLGDDLVIQAARADGTAESMTRSGT